ncbi:MAG: amidohydrolase family protein [Proteobacteria bacterium]|nr:amidohydrolase family protein [Pseudomonadota bacterium]MBU4472086.1 amidohydrolase family protein [Pseudomonadota bacterium]MCG2752915.1 amidohydrolase family protein [Desulfobacteraceae bacterium]
MIIDFECDSPTLEVKKATIELLKSGGGFVHRGYFSQFGHQWAAMLGMTKEAFDEAQKTMGLIELALLVAEKYLGKTMTGEEFIAMLDDAGISKACIGTTGMWASLEDRAAFAAKYKDRLIPFFRSSPHEGMADVRKFEQAVRDMDFKGLVVSGFRENLPSNHKKYYPFYAKCVELGVPARITTSLHLYTDRPMDLCRPACIDEIACDFPELDIVAGLGGWPWIPELIAVARRHKNVCIDLSCVRPKNLLSPASGYAELIEHFNRGLQDQMIFASGWGTQGLPVKQIIGETEQLARSETIRRKWMYENAARILTR